MPFQTSSIADLVHDRRMETKHHPFWQNDWWCILGKCRSHPNHIMHQVLWQPPQIRLEACPFAQLIQATRFLVNSRSVVSPGIRSGSATISLPELSLNIHPQRRPMIPSESPGITCVEKCRIRVHGPPWSTVESWCSHRAPPTTFYCQRAYAMRPSSDQRFARSFVQLRHCCALGKSSQARVNPRSHGLSRHGY